METRGYIQGQNRKVKLSLWRGLRQCCPNCGTQALFRAYLKPVEQCEFCGENWEEVRADDGPAWLTILIVGHVIGPLFVAALLSPAVPRWIIWGGIPFLTVLLSLWLLPRAKGAFMGIIWATRAPTS